MAAVLERIAEAPLDRRCDGDALVVWKLDRLGPGVKNLVYELG